jgi:putative endopeptidase
MKLETELAGASRKLEALRDPQKNYNAMSLDEITAITPSIHWREFLEVGHVTGIDTVIVGQPEFFKQVEASLGSQPLDAWKTYLRWALTHAFADLAGGKFDDENFHFYETILNGTPKQRERFKRVLDTEGEHLGFALGQLYVEKYFTPQAKERYSKLTDEVFATMGEHIRALDWMSPATKERALGKLGTVVKKVGYPDKWRDYSTYKVDRSSYLMNCVQGNIWQTEYGIAKLNKPVDRTEWFMTPQTYNAYYNPSNNEMVLPAAAFILPGIDDSQIDDAIVYGYAAGSTIGHELTHGFDDEGRQFDERGNLKEWWTPEDAAEFKKRAERIVKQFNDYIATGDVHVNGSATQGENIADLGGVTIAYDALQRALAKDPSKRKAIDGFTPEQRFFLGWAQVWAAKATPEFERSQVKGDPHSAAKYRVNGPMSNMPEFAKAWGCKEGDRMVRKDACLIW